MNYCYEFRKWLILSIFSFPLFLFACSSSIKSTPDNDAVSSPAATTENSQASQLLHKHASEFGVNTNGYEFVLKSESKDEAGRMHYRWQAMIENIPVWSAVLTSHVNENGNLYRIDGQLPEVKKPITKSGQVDSNIAKANAERALGNQGEAWQATKIDQLYYPVAPGDLQLAYQVTLHKGFERKFVFISAQSGDVLHTLKGNLD